MMKMHTIGFLGTAAIVACWALAVILHRVGAPDSVARKLSLLLFFEGFTLLTAGYPFMALSLIDGAVEPNPLIQKILFILHTIGDAAMLALYPPFLAAALQTKMTRPFAGKRMQIALMVVAVGLVFAIQLSAWEIGAGILYISLSLLFGFSLVASINAWHKAAGVNRARAGSFAFAFGLRDVSWGLVYGSSLYLIWSGTYMASVDTDFELQLKIVYALGTLFCVPLIAYGILRTHLFDIDLKIRWTIKQSTLATLVVTFMFLLSEGADRYLSSALGDFAGLIAAAVVVFFLAPLQRFAEGVASAAMPKTQNTPEYVAFRKMQVYEEAVTEAQHENGISDRERALLVRLRDSLGISESDAEAIETAIAN